MLRKLWLLGLHFYTACKQGQATLQHSHLLIQDFAELIQGQFRITAMDVKQCVLHKPTVPHRYNA